MLSGKNRVPGVIPQIPPYLVLVALALTGSSIMAGTQVELPPRWQPRIVAVAGGAPGIVGGEGMRPGLVDVVVWPTNAVDCAYNPSDLSRARLFPLWVARGNEPVELLEISGDLRLVERDAARFPELHYTYDLRNGEPDPSAPYRFMVGFPNPASNVAIKATDQRTWLPEAVHPSAVASSALGRTEFAPLDARIQIVWPHDGAGYFAPPDEAVFVNIAVDLFVHGTRISVPVEFSGNLGLPNWGGPALGMAKNNQPFAYSSSGPRSRKETYTLNGQLYPRWVFDDVPVVPGAIYHFMAVPAEDLRVPSQRGSIWTHAAAEGPANEPPEIPPSCVD